MYQLTSSSCPSSLQITTLRLQVVNNCLRVIQLGNGTAGEGNGTPTPILLPGKSHGQRSLVGCSPWRLEESDTTEWLHFHFLLSCIGEGNGNPLQCSCLEDPRDRRAWWAAVCGVAQGRTQLKWLSSRGSIPTTIMRGLFISYILGRCEPHK